MQQLSNVVIYDKSIRRMLTCESTHDPESGLDPDPDSG